MFSISLKGKIRLNFFSQIWRALKKIKFNIKVNKFAYFFHFLAKTKFVDTF
jgi:hypothetical protein